MDQQQLTTWMRALRGVPSRREVVRALGGAGLGLAGPCALHGLSATAAKKNNTRKTKKVCHCDSAEAASCRTIKVTKQGKKQHLKRDACDYSGPCTGVSGCAAGAPPPGCSPEPQATTCAPGCGPRINNCNQTITCPCPSGQSCLPNGTCARPCGAGGSTCTGCTQNSCSISSSEGPMYCISAATPCRNLQPCNPTADTRGCPQGFVCLANCDGSARCAAVAVCPPT